MLSGIFYWTMFAVPRSLRRTHPVLLVLLTGAPRGSSPPPRSPGSARTLIVVLLAALVGIMKFDPLYWWAGRSGASG